MRRVLRLRQYEDVRFVFAQLRNSFFPKVIGYLRGNIAAKTVNSKGVNPVQHVGNHGRSHIGIVVVEIGHIGPTPGFAGSRINGVNDVAGCVLRIPIGLRCNPWMVPARMVGYPVDDDAHAQGVDAVDQSSEVTVCAKFGIDAPVVGNGIIASQTSLALAEAHRMDRHEPQDIYPHSL